MFTRKFTGLILTSCLMQTASAAGGSYDYQTNGADWPDAYPECALTNQSPIDLSKSVEGYTNYKATADNFNKLYTNQV